MTEDQLRMRECLNINSTIDVIALHGFTGSGLDFKPLADATHAEINWHCPDLTDDLQKLASTFKKKSVLLGYSMGGRLSLHLALANPDLFSALVLIGASPGIAETKLRKERYDADLQLAKTIEKIGTRKFIDQWQQTDLIKSQQNIDVQIYKEMLQRRYASSATNLANILRNYSPGVLPSLWDELPKIKIPVFLYTGVNDLKFTKIAKEMNALIPDSKHIILANTGHAAHLENMTDFIDSLTTNILCCDKA